MKQFITLACDRLATEISIKILLSQSYSTLKVEDLALILYIKFLPNSLPETAQFIYVDANVQSSKRFEIIPYSKLCRNSNFKLFDLKKNLIGLGHVEKRWNQPAIAEEWKTVFMPEKMVRIDFVRVFTEQEFERIKLGIFPLSMDDKWFVYFEGGHLYCHRSWTGICIFDVQIETISNEFVTTQVLANNHEFQESSISLDRHNYILNFIFSLMCEEAKVLYG